MKTPIILPAVTLLYVILLTLASALPSAGQSGGGWDSGISSAAQNMLHIPAYALLTLLVLTTAERIRPISGKAAVGLTLGCIVYGALLEALQAAAIPGRTGSLSDSLWNAIGGTGGYAAWLLFRNIASQRVNLGRPEAGDCRL